MKQLKQRLVEGLRQNPHIQIEKEMIWTLPVQMIKVTYETVQQSKMDILMKMMLTTVQQGTFTTIDQLTNILLVERRFIQHMIDKMERAHLIEQVEEGHYALTKKGRQQLSEGLFIDEPETCTTTVLYSVCHQKMIQNQAEMSLEEEIEAEYRHYDRFSNWQIDDFPLQEVKGIIANSLQSVDAHIQTVISSIDEGLSIGMDFIPCIEFLIYDWEQEVRYRKIWNTYMNEWDEVLAEQAMVFDREAEEV